MKKVNLYMLVAIAGIFMASMAIAETYPEGVVSYWKFDDGTGTAATDSVGTNNGTLQNGLESGWTTGIVGGALDLDGIDDYVFVPDDDSLDFTDQMTIEAWFYVDPITLPDQQIVRKEWSYALVPIHNYNLLPPPPPDTFYQSFLVWIYGWHKPYASTNGLLQEQLPVYPPAWHHIVGTYDSAEQKIKIYTDGIFRSDSCWPEPGGGCDSSIRTGPIDVNANPLTIGAAVTGVNIGNPYEGKVDEVAVYNRALTPQEILLHYENGLIGLGYEIPELTCNGFEPPMATAEPCRSRPNSSMVMAPQLPMQISQHRRFFKSFSVPTQLRT
jgi:hypothetical protein